ncbi:hypothetical protein AKG98_1976 [Moritella sp. JT01]|uniref:tetratricopeptide repeat protein n=1 Tax=Moritella sp. JT01 TaxID=756698 RepID=UPI00079C4024|nr:tetratricopeptide repeat protein [Moritella sp. JT01]KXO08377.1 hypothetical protein AKG98_1976 [Moritella sp. JT01]
MKQIITLCMLITLTACSAKKDNHDNHVQAITDAAGNPLELGVLSLRHKGTYYESKVAFNVLGSDIIFEIENDEEINAAELINNQDDLELFEDILDEEEPASEDIGKALRLLSAAQQLAVDKDYPEALVKVEDAIKAAPSLAQTHALKGSVNYRMKNYANARAAWNKALELDPSYEDVQNALTKMGDK